MVQELRTQNLYRSTLIIVSAKHGQSPIDRTKNQNIANGQPSTLLGASESFDISDDGSLIWLANSSLTSSVVSMLSEPANQQLLGIQEIFAGQSLIDKFNSPLNDPRTPDIILKVNTGVIFTGGTKIAEHGGFNEDDVHTALLLSMDGIEPAVVKAATTNQQVAPTILQALGLNPSSLDAVRNEQITVLPFLFESTP
jgi:arylsulfatase A-like enzyme